MARRQVFMKEIFEIIYQWHQGIRVKGIRRSMGFDRNVIRKLVRSMRLDYELAHAAV